MHLEVIILRFWLAIFSLEKPMFFEEKRDGLLLPEPTEPGVKTWPKAHRNAARSGSLLTARFWPLLLLPVGRCGASTAAFHGLVFVVIGKLCGWWCWLVCSRLAWTRPRCGKTLELLHRRFQSKPRLVQIEKGETP